MRFAHLIIFGLSVILCGCGSQRNFAKIENSFHLVNYEESSECRNKLAKQKLRLETEGRRENTLSGIALQLNDCISKDPLVAEFIYEQNIPCGDMNFVFHLREKALRTLINKGNFEYIDDYWSNLYKQTVGYRWFTVDYALAATSYIAKQTDIKPNIRSYAQLTLANYYIHGLHTYELANRYKQRTIIDVVFGYGNPQPELAAKWFSQYAANEYVNESEKFSAAKKIADDYFRNKQYGIAAGWYIASLSISDEDRLRIISSDIENGFRMFFHYNRKLDEVIEDAKLYARKKYSNDYQKCVTRLELIREAGIKVISFSPEAKQS